MAVIYKAFQVTSYDSSGTKVSFSTDFQTSEDLSSWVSVSADQVILIKNGETQYFRRTTQYGGYCHITGKAVIAGDLLQLHACGEWTSLTDVHYQEDYPPYAFKDFFFGSDIVSANDLNLPFARVDTFSHTLSKGMFEGLFSNCRLLTTPPSKLQVDENYPLTEECFKSMFNGCRKLRNFIDTTSDPYLPAIHLAPYCYEDMFAFTDIDHTPVLPALNLAPYCYAAMFRQCKSLAVAPTLKAPTLVNGCYQQMFEGCESLVNGPKLPATELFEDCYRIMFRDCTSLDNIVIKAPKPSCVCTHDMFQNVHTYGNLIDSNYNNWKYSKAGRDGIPQEWSEKEAEKFKLTIKLLSDIDQSAVTFNYPSTSDIGEGSQVTIVPTFADGYGFYHKNSVDMGTTRTAEGSWAHSDVPNATVTNDGTISFEMPDHDVTITLTPIIRIRINSWDCPDPLKDYVSTKIEVVTRGDTAVSKHYNGKDEVWAVPPLLNNSTNAPKFQARCIVGSGVTNLIAFQVFDSEGRYSSVSEYASQPSAQSYYSFQPVPKTNPLWTPMDFKLKVFPYSPINVMLQALKNGKGIPTVAEFEQVGDITRDYPIVTPASSRIAVMYEADVREFVITTHEPWIYDHTRITMTPTGKFPITETTDSVIRISPPVGCTSVVLAVYWTDSPAPPPIKTYNVVLSTNTVEGVVPGTVSGAGTYAEGTKVTIKATAKSGYVFSKWSDGSTETSRSITVDRDYNLQAVFAKVDPGNITVSVKVGPTGSGTATGGGVYKRPEAGGSTKVTLSATPASGYEFVRWVFSDGTTSTKQTTSLYLKPEDPDNVEVSCVFKLKPGFTLTAVTEPEGVGALTFTPAQPTNGYAPGTVVTVDWNYVVPSDATDPKNWQFVHPGKDTWSGVPGDQKPTGRSCTVTMDSNLSLSVSTTDQYNSRNVIVTTGSGAKLKAVPGHEDASPSYRLYYLDGTSDSCKQTVEKGLPAGTLLRFGDGNIRLSGTGTSVVRASIQIIAGNASKPRSYKWFAENFAGYVDLNVPTTEYVTTAQEMFLNSSCSGIVRCTVAYSASVFKDFAKGSTGNVEFHTKAAYAAAWTTALQNSSWTVIGDL